jgi:hypothetical protein
MFLHGYILSTSTQENNQRVLLQAKKLFHKAQIPFTLGRSIASNWETPHSQSTIIPEIGEWALQASKNLIHKAHKLLTWWEGNADSKYWKIMVSQALSVSVTRSTYTKMGREMSSHRRVNYCSQPKPALLAANFENTSCSWQILLVNPAQRKH